MQVRKAVITAAGHGTRQFPATRAIQKELLPVVDLDGVTRPALHILLAQALAAGIERVGLVVSASSETELRRYLRAPTAEEMALFGGREDLGVESARIEALAQAVDYVRQPSPEGFGHAVYCARDWVGDEPFLLLLGDHLYLADEGEESCLAQVLAVFAEQGANMSSVALSPAEELHLFGTVRARPLKERLFEVERLVEKPSPELARRELRTPGLPEDRWLTFFGMHVFTPAIFDALEYLIRNDVRERGEIQLTAAQELVRRSNPYLAYLVAGTRHDLGTPEGYAETVLSFFSARKRHQ
ncbi:MAG: NTP transferase domain-containing protein [Armatimonadetes bacterium]|nr:NTP transferase domain-containing protein [Armatimonadota bacterium]